MKLFLVGIVFCVFGLVMTRSQTVTGKILDDIGTPLPNIDLKLYANSTVYNTSTNSSGNFTFNVISDADDENLPEGYFVSNNYPNPFNPLTRLIISSPVRTAIIVEVFNTLGQTVMDNSYRQINEGTNHIDLEFAGLPNGIYFTRIQIDNKYTVTKKMILAYGSQHLLSHGELYSSIHKPHREENFVMDTIIDSLVAESSIIGRKVFLQFPPITGGNFDLGNIILDRHCPGLNTVTYEGIIYNTLQIGNQCWLRENLNVGIRINSSQIQSNNGTLEKYCYDDNPANCISYGALYQWNEAMQYINMPGTKGVCPPGWHLPTLNELQTFSTIVGDNSNVLKTVGQGSGGGAGTNTSGFSALLTGYMNYDGNFNYLSEVTHFWSSIEADGTSSYSLHLGYNNNGMFLINYNKDDGFCVRCIKD